jgi:hypothetical protein
VDRKTLIIRDLKQLDTPFEGVCTCGACSGVGHTGKGGHVEVQTKFREIDEGSFANNALNVEAGWRNLDGEAEMT